MSAEDGEQELLERVRRLETLVASLEDRLQQLELKGPPAVPASPPRPAPSAALGRLLIVDLSRLPIGQRVITFILLGVMLLAVSYTYTRLRDRKG
jgi:hypothetical protein